MKPFSKHDWYGFAGAEEEHGKPALIGYTNNFVIVVDIHGIGIYSADGLDTFGIELPYPIATFVAMKIEDMQDKYVTPQFLTDLGFIKY